MKLSDRIVVPAQVMARQVGEETIILDLASGMYFGLDAVGARVWRLMGEGRTLAQICDTMRAEYAVSAEDIERDVLSLAESLCSRQLISAV
jgi:hypothetical protein